MTCPNAEVHTWHLARHRLDRREEYRSCDLMEGTRIRKSRVQEFVPVYE